MKKWITRAAAVFALVFLTGAVFADRPKRPEKEDGDMKKIRVQSEQLRIARIKLGVKKGFIKQDRADYMIKKIRFWSSFKSDNPQWVKYGRRFRKHGRRGKWGRRGPRGKWGRRGPKGKWSKRDRRGSRDERRGFRKDGKKAQWFKNLTSETSELKALRHQRNALKIAHIRFAMKKGFISKARGTFRIKKINAASRFKDNNPDWVKYKRPGRKGPRGRRGHRDHGRRGPGDQGRW